MKKTKYFIISLLLIVFMTPSVSFASWWNPISWFDKEQTIETSTEISTSIPILIPEIKTESNWWNPFSWYRKEQPATSQPDNKTTGEENSVSIDVEDSKEDITENKQEKNVIEIKQPQQDLETAKAKAEAERYRLQAEQAKLELEKVKQQSQTQNQTETKQEENKNSIVALPNGAVAEIGVNENIIKTIKKTPTKLEEFVQTTPTTTNQSCQADIWSCDDYDSCPTSGSQTRSCTKTFDCSSVNTPSPAITQNCTPPVEETYAYHDYYPIILSLSDNLGTIIKNSGYNNYKGYYSKSFQTNSLKIGDLIYIKVEASDSKNRPILYLWDSVNADFRQKFNDTERGQLGNWTLNNEINYTITEETLKNSGELLRIVVSIKTEKENFRNTSSKSNYMDDVIFIDYNLRVE